MPTLFIPDLQEIRRGWGSGRIAQRLSHPNIVGNIHALGKAIDETRLIEAPRVGLPRLL